MSTILKFLNPTLFIACMSIFLKADPLQASSQKYPFASDLRVKAITYTLDTMKCISLNLINNNLTSVDSLEIRVYFTAPEEDLEPIVYNNDTLYKLGARPDVIIVYNQNGFQQTIPDSTSLREIISQSKPQMIPGSYDSNTGEYGWYFPITLKGISLPAGTMVRIDLVWDTRVSSPPYHNFLLRTPKYVPGDSDWSWGAKRRAHGYPADFNGIKDTTKDAIDNPTAEIDPYITVYRNGTLLSGLPPSWKTYYGEDFDTIAAVRQDPLPYAPIAIPFSEYEDQRIRDSANMKISRVRVNQAGYRQQDKKYFYYVADGIADVYKIIDKSGNPAGNGTLTSTVLTTAGKIKIKASNNGLLVGGGDTRYTMESPEISGTIYEGLLPDLAKGKYRVIVGTDTSSSFTIDDHLYNWVRDALLKFYGVNRCGDSHSWFHKPCHLKDPVTGGWHDAGDHLKEGISLGYTAAVLGLSAAVFQNNDQDVYGEDQSKTVITDGISDILYEARQGSDFILQSYDKASGQAADMITSVGSLGTDHMFWGKPECQEDMPTARGGSPREARKELGANILGDYVANLAFVSKLIKMHDPVYSDRCLKAARDIYTFTKAHSDSISNSPAYNGSVNPNDKLAFAAMALTWATGERNYLDDLCYDKVIGTKSNPIFPKLSFDGGWFANTSPNFCHGADNTGWSSVHVYVLWGFFRLVLMDEQLCTSLNLTDLQRKVLIEKTAYNLIGNLGSIGVGAQTISLPSSGGWTPDEIKYDLPWMTMHTQMEWVWNQYQSGNITEMYCYYDIASKIQGMELPNTPATTNWKAGDTKEILVRMLDYMLGVNPWDICMIDGIGSKNLNHPHHRASNPELRNSLYEYDYRHPTGALMGGYKPTSSLYSEFAGDYQHSEFSINSTTSLFLPVCGMSASDGYTGLRFNLNGKKNNIDNKNFLITTQGKGKGFTIKSGNPVESVIISNMAGQVLGKYNYLSKQQKTINLVPVKGADFPGGVYLVRVNYVGGGTRCQKVNAVWR